MEKLNVLFTSVGNLAFPIVRECLKKTFPDCKIVGTDVRVNAHGLYFCDKKYVVDYRNSPNYLRQIFYIIEKETINTLFPLSTEDQSFFSKNIDVFERRGIKVICSDFDVVDVVNNKFKLYNKLKELKLPYPSFYKIERFSEVNNIIEKIGYPFVIKSFTGTGGKGLYIIDKDPNSLRKDDMKFFERYDDFISNIERYVKLENTMICEYLSGDEYSIDTLSKDGKFYYGVVRKRYASEGGMALEAEVIKDDNLLELAQRVVKYLRLSYINNIQIKRDKKGIPKIMEINPRIPGTLILSIKAGADFIVDAIKLAYNDKVEIPKKIRYGLKIIRYWTGVFVSKEDEASIIDLRKQT